MPDIKTRAVVEKDVKTIDKSAIAAQRMKNAYVQAKENAEHNISYAEETPEGYAADHVSDGTSIIAHESVQLFDRQGRKSVEVTKENIAKARHIVRAGIASWSNCAVPLGTFAICIAVIFVAHSRVYEFHLGIANPEFTENTVFGSFGMMFVNSGHD